MKRKRLIALITAATLTAITVPNLNWKSDSSLVAEASDFTPIDYTNPENQTLSEEDLALMHEDNWLNRLVVEHSATDYTGDNYNKGGSRSGHTLEQLDLNDFLAVTEISKLYSGITELPESVKFLGNLTFLSLGGNQLTRIPDSIGNLTKLTTLVLSNNKLTSVPNSIGNLTNLTSLGLGNNELIQIPESIGNLTNLTELILYSDKDLTALPESIGNLTNLTTLNLNESKLTSLPESIGNLTNLTELDLCNNDLISLPESIGNLTKLPKLDLRENNLTSLPNSIGNLTNLTELNLSTNQLTSLPESIINLTNLTKLSLQYNKLYSSPDSIRNLTNITKLSELVLDGNGLTSLPDSIGNLTNLTSLSLQHNKITSIPDSAGNLTNLTYLDLEENSLTSLPESIGNLTNLTKLFLLSNKIKQLPESIGNLSKLSILGLGKNKLTQLPDSIGNLVSLTKLDLHENSLASLPESIGNLASLTTLNLDSNSLTSLPNSIGNLANLTILVLTNNRLISVPDSIGNLTNLTQLDLGAANLTQIPESIGNLTNLTKLDLSMNRLTSLPESINNLTNLTKLALDENYLTKKYTTKGDYSHNFIDSVQWHEELSDCLDTTDKTLSTSSTRSDLIKDKYDSIPKSVEERLVISSSNTNVIGDDGNIVGMGECDVTISLPGNPEGNQAGQATVHVIVTTPVDAFTTAPSKDNISNALNELDSKRDSGEDITAKKDEIINKGKEYVSNSEVSKQDKYDYIDKIIDNLVDEDKKVVERTDVVETIKELPTYYRKPPIDSLVDKTQDTSGTFIQGGNQFATKGLGITLKVGEKLDLSKAVEVTYNGVKIDDSKLSDLSLPDVTTEEFNKYFDENKIAIKGGSLTSKIRLTAEYDPNENELKTPSLTAGLMKAFGLNDENVVSNPAETEPVTINIIQPVVSSGETTANGDIEVKYNLNETAQLILSSDSVTFGSNTGLTEVEQDGTLTATVKSSTTYDLDFTPQSDLINQEYSYVTIPSTKANVKIADGEFKVLPEPYETINLVSNEEKTTDLEDRKKDYSLKFKIDEIIGSKAGTYKMPVRITLTQK